jgi:quinoprotein glucose dehydrogenase
MMSGAKQGVGVRTAGVTRANRFIVFIVAGLSAGLLAVTAGGVGAARSDKWWWDNLGGPDSSSFANLDQIRKTNVARLDVAWTYPYASPGFNPVVVDDVLYTAGRAGSLVALDASTGTEIWVHEGLGGMTSRGLNYWQSDDGRDRRLLFLINNFLQAVDARTGQSILSFGQNGVVNLREGLPRGEYMGWSSNSPGKVWRNLLILGSTTGEAFMSPPGDIRAYDVVTGKLAWQFRTIPRPGEFGYETWPRDAYKYVGAANNWGSMSVDDERGIVYVPTGSATYDFYGADRHGENLFANCILALDARTGKRIWHFQTIHHDLWDLDNVSAPLLVSVRHGGRRIDAVAHAGKTGFLYVFNRVTGEPLWPIEERPVPASDAPFEMAWPTQPFPTRPAPFARQSFSVDDVNPWLLKPDEYQAMRERIAKARNGEGPQGGLFIPPGVEREAISMPGNQGGSNWGTTAANPARGLVFIVNVNQVALLKLEDVTRRGADGDGPASPQMGAAAYRESCQVCHGSNLEGAGAGVPSLVGVTDRMGEDAIRAIVTGGRGLMRPVTSVTPEQLTALVSFLTVTNPNRVGGGRGRGEAPALPPGPVVASGGAPRPTLPARGVGAYYPGVGGNAGNYAYPTDVEVPPARYMSEYGVHASATKPPYTELVAYDLNTGEIKWKVPTGDHAPTIAAGGPSNTGGLGARNGLVATRGGLVFHAGGDGKFRAYDEDTGRVLWTGSFTGNAPGVPVSYESRGRQYVVMIAGSGGGARGEAAPPSGMLAFALPQR